MIGNIRTAFIDILEKSTWMDEVSKRKAIEKVKERIDEENNERKSIFFSFSFQALSIDEKIGYPDYLGSDNTTELENDYAEVC